MPRINFQDLPLTDDQARAARNYFGWPQAKAAEEGGLSLNKLKRFESGNYVPDPEFLQSLRDFYERRGYKFDDTPAPGAKAKEKGLVFPAGVVGESDEEPRSGARTARASFHHMRISLTDEGEMGRVLDMIEDNETEARRLLGAPVETGLFGGLTEGTQTRHAHALRLLAENGVLFAKLFGRCVGGAPAEDVIAGKKKPDTHAELLHRVCADAHLASRGDLDAKERHKVKKPANSLTAALGLN